jgi:hypothetical protein
MHSPAHGHNLSNVMVRPIPSYGVSITLRGDRPPGYRLSEGDGRSLFPGVRGPPLSERPRLRSLPAFA